jgi:ribosomal-protein-alanine N-acetyltransferase
LRCTATRRYAATFPRAHAHWRKPAELEWFLDGHPRHPELGLWATVDKASGTLVGRCGLLPWTIGGRLEIELAFLNDKARWGEGLGTEAALGIVQHAFTALDLRRLVCVVMPGNARSVAVATRVGMRFERDYTDEHGACHLYARVRDPPGP